MCFSRQKDYFPVKILNQFLLLGISLHTKTLFVQCSFIRDSGLSETVTFSMQKLIKKGFTFTLTIIFELLSEEGCLA